MIATEISRISRTISGISTEISDFTKDLRISTEISRISRKISHKDFNGDTQGGCRGFSLHVPLGFKDKHVFTAGKALFEPNVKIFGKGCNNSLNSTYTLCFSLMLDMECLHVQFGSRYLVCLSVCLSVRRLANLAVHGTGRPIIIIIITRRMFNIDGEREQAGASQLGYGRDPRAAKRAVQLSQ